jgi:drug/metabolite transporter (DMT)-like permease
MCPSPPFHRQPGDISTLSFSRAVAKTFVGTRLLDVSACVGNKVRGRCRQSRFEGDGTLSFSGLLQLGFSTVIFLLAATAAKQWGLAPSLGKILLTLALYSLGNLIMLRLIREFGMSVSFSLSAVIQLVSVNVVALVFFGERVNALQASGIVLAIAAVALITLGPYLQGR